MTLIANEKDLKIIGYPQSLLTNDLIEIFSNKIDSGVSIITPEDFLNLKNKDIYQYTVGIGLELQERKQIIDIVDDLQLDVVSYIDPSVQINKSAKIGRGVLIFFFSTIMQNVKIGDHCIIEAYCLISHNCSIGTNCIIHAGSMIAGATTIGNNCMFNFKSAALNRLTISDNVIVGALSTITKDITEAGTYIGTPARKIK
jgi:sugar O-acyltransferase (sialic acid O-acetyltransferase NeuD family)